MSIQMPWGIYDTFDNVWMGNDDGPKLFSDRIDAKIAAQIVDQQLGNEPGRCREKPFEEQPLRLRDQQQALMTPEAALKSIEEGPDVASEPRTLAWNGGGWTVQ